MRQDHAPADRGD
jgi:hypothetical protein